MACESGATTNNTCEHKAPHGSSRLPKDSLQSNALLANLSKPEIPSLFGLRGAAALAVVFFHYLQDWKPASFFPGPYAVTLFFELSGLLITWLLLVEIDINGQIDLRHFYV